MPDKSEIATDLIARFVAGDDDALADLFSFYHDRLKRIVRFRLDHRLARRISDSDVIQELYLSASQRMKHYRNKPEMPFFVWLRLLLNQQLADLHRQHLQAEMRDARKEISLEHPSMTSHTSYAMAAHLVGRGTSPSQAFSRVEKIASLEQALNRMAPIDREVIALRHFEELTNHEVADVLKIDVQAASKRYIRAMKRMKEIISDVPGLNRE